MGYSRGGVSGGFYRGGYGGGYRSGGGFFGSPGFYGRGYGNSFPHYGYGHRGWGYGGWGYSSYPVFIGGFGLGYGGWGYGGWDGFYSPYYDYPYYDYGYYPGSTYSYAPSASYSYPSAPASPPVVINNYPEAAPRLEPQASAYQPPIYSIAFRDHRIIHVLAYWVVDGTLHYVTRDHEMREIPLSEIDRSFSEQINRDRGVDFRLPAQ